MGKSVERNWNWLLALLALLLLPALALGRLGLSVNRTWLLVGAGAISLFTFLLYLADKGRAKTQDRRLPEVVLHLCEALGGWPGAFAAQHVVRHKNAKLSYQIVFWGIVAAHQFVALDYLLGWTLWNWLT